MNIKLLKRNIKLIKEEIELEIFDSNMQFDIDIETDIKALLIYDEFELELLNWYKINLDTSKYSTYGDYLSNKYLAIKLDSYKTTRHVKMIRKFILTIIDKYLFQES